MTGRYTEMRIYPGTRANLEACQEWSSVQSIALRRGVRSNSVNASMVKCLREGLVSQRRAQVDASAGIRFAWYEYKITATGMRVLQPAMFLDEKPDAAPAAPAGKNPWENLRYD